MEEYQLRWSSGIVFVHGPQARYKLGRRKLRLRSYRKTSQSNCIFDTFMSPPTHQDNKLIEITAIAFEKSSTTCGEQL